MRRYRRGLQVGLLMVIAAFIASLVVFGQRGFGGGAGRGAVATVNGESIPLARYQQRCQAFMEAYARIYRDRFSPELAERLGLPQQVVNELIQEALIVQRARAEGDRKSTRLNSSHDQISYAAFCLKKKKNIDPTDARLEKLSDVYR